MTVTATFTVNRHGGKSVATNIKAYGSEIKEKQLYGACNLVASEATDNSSCRVTFVEDGGESWPMPSGRTFERSLRYKPIATFLLQAVGQAV